MGRAAYYQITRFWIRLALVCAVLSTPAFIAGADRSRAPERIVDAEDPYRTTPLDPKAAAGVEEVENISEQIADDQEKLKAGQIKQEEYDKSLAEKKQRVAEVAATQPKSAPVQTSAARFDIQAGDYASAVDRASTAMKLAPKDPFPVTTRFSSRPSR